MMDKENTLYILWTNADINTSLHMVMMYATNSMLKSWWKNVTVIVWGATAKLAAENADVQEKIKMAMHAGVRFSACIACARNLGVIEPLEKAGIEIIAWGDPLTRLIKDGCHLLTV
ncbi:MAG: DsrE family protein [Christensenellales bacterium]